MRRNVLLVLLSIIISFISYGQNNESQTNRPHTWAQPVTDIQLANMYKVDEGVYRAEQPTKNDFIALEKYGIKEILNLRGWHSDKNKAKGTNLKLHRIKMHAHDINDNEVIDALRIIKNRQGAIVIHCKHGSDRTGLIVAMYRIIFQNWSKNEAIDELKNGGYGFHSIYSNIPRYIENINTNEIKQHVNK